MIYAAHRIRLVPTPAQAEKFHRFAGAKRFWFNWGLDRWKKLHAIGEKVNDNRLRKELTQLKKTDEFAWVNEVPQAVTANGLRDLGVAFKNFFRRVKKGEKPGFPRFKRHGEHDSFNCWDKPNIRVNGKRIRVAGMWIKMREAVRFDGKIIRASVVKEAGQWFVSVVVETRPPAQRRVGSGDVGIDLGCKTQAVLSDGTEYRGAKSLKSNLKRLAKLQRKLAKQKKGSNRRNRTKIKIARLYQRIKNIRAASVHAMTTEIVLRFGRIAIEDLNVKGMSKLRSIARSVNDQAFGEIRRQLEYKSKWYGSELHVVDRWFPSSKKCSCCGKVKEKLSLSERVYRCDSCGFEIDRDFNSAINLKEEIPGLARKSTHVESSRPGTELPSRKASAKRETKCDASNAAV